MGQVIAYLRVSTDKQEISNQRFSVEKFCKERGIEVTEWVEDIITGTTSFSERKINEIYLGLKKGDTIVVAEMSRLSRTVAGTVLLIDNMLKKGINLYCIKENFELKDDLHSRLFTTLYGMFSQIERERISQRTKEGLAARKAAGVKLGRKFGSKTDPTKKRAYIHGKKIKEMSKAGYTYVAIGKEVGISNNTVKRYLKGI